MLKHEGGGGCIADRSAMGTAIRQRIDGIVRLLEIHQEIEISVGIIQDGEIDEPLAIIAA